MQSNTVAIAVIVLLALVTAGCDTGKQKELVRSLRFNESTDFAEVFQRVDQFALACSKEVPLGTVLDCEVDPAGNLVVVDFEHENVKKYDPEGNLLTILGEKGRGAGQFILPIDLCVGSLGEVYVTDLRSARTNMFDARGNLLHSFMMFEGYSPRRIAVNSNGQIYIGGSKFLTKNEALLIHEYSASGEYIRSFYPIDPKIPGMHLWMTSGVLFDIDQEGHLYCAQPVANEISVYDSGGSLLRKFGREASFYKGPNAISEKDTSEAFLDDWIRSWTQIADVRLSPDGLVFVVFNTQEPTEFVIDIYSRTGELLKGGISTNLRLLCFDQSGFAYFYANTGPHHTIHKCEVKIARTKGDPR